MYKDKSIKISIIFPVFNEVNSIERVLREWIAEAKKLHIFYEVIICEDGSTDGTSQLLKKLKKTLSLKLNQSTDRRGYGRAIIAGIKSAKYDSILCVDSDGQCDPKDLHKFLLAKDKAEVLIGWRVKRADAISRLLYSKLFGLVFYTLFPTDIHDPSAPFVTFSKKRFIPLTKYLLYLKEGFWWGFVATCNKNNITIIEIPISHRPRYDGKTQVYHINRMLAIALNNIYGLIKLKLS